MKIIFLDIDGVLVTRRLGVFEEPLLKNLKRIVDETGSTIVLSSDWRRHPAARFEAKRVLATVGLTFIACTPALSAYIAQRPTEILQWKKDFCKRDSPDRLTNWIAIDDRPLLEERHGSYLRGHFVQTQPMRGITEQVADDCIAILNQDPQRGLASAAQTLAEIAAPDHGTMGGLGASVRLGATGGSGIRGSSTEAPGRSLLGESTRKRSSLPAQGLGAALAPLGAAALGPGAHSYGLMGQGDGGGAADTLPSGVPAGLPSVGRQRGRSTGAPPMVGSRRNA